MGFFSKLFGSSEPQKKPTELGRNEKIGPHCEYEGRESKCPKVCSECAIDIKTQGDMLIATRRFNEAISKYKIAVEKAPDFAEAWNNMANAYGFMGDYENALATFEHAISIDPTYGKALFGKAITLKNMGREMEAWNVGQHILTMYDNPDVDAFCDSIRGCSTMQRRMDQRKQ